MGPHLVEVAAGVALIGAVEERNCLPLLDDGSKCLPLLLRRVDTRGVMGTGMQQHDATRCHLRQVLAHALKVQALSLLQ
eukprot:SAG11_NODE_61_length_19011_cov_49.624048_5_plen_79_part_00